MPEDSTEGDAPPQMPENSEVGQPAQKNPGDWQGRGGGKGGGADQTNDADIIKINGGSLVVDAGGDGIDSNGSLIVTGGTTYIYGPTNGGNSALDYAGTATISGGTIVAVGASGMAQNFGTDSTQGSMLVTISDTMTEGDLSLKDSNDNVLVSCSPSKAYNSVLISCPELAKGEVYTLTTGTVTTDVEMTSLVYGTDDRSMGGGGLPGKEKRRQ